MTVRAMDMARLGLGISELVATRRIAAIELGVAPEEHEVVIARILGVRQAGQAVLSMMIGPFRVVGAIVDVLHAASMIALATLGPARTRRAAVIQTAIAGSFAAFGFLAARRR